MKISPTDIGEIGGSVYGCHNQTYTTPKFEDTSIYDAKAKARKILDQSDELLAQSRKLNQRATDWVDLMDELNKQGLTKVNQLPEKRQRYWKNKLEERIISIHD